MSYQSVIIASNPFAYWRLNDVAGGGVAVDEMGVNNGTYSNSTDVSISVIQEGNEAQNAKQLITLTTPGAFKVSFVPGETTNAMPGNAASTLVEQQISYLTGIGVGNVTVSGDAGGPYTVEFINTMGNQSVALLVVSGCEVAPTLDNSGPIDKAANFSFIYNEIDATASTGAFLDLGTLGNLGSSQASGFTFECWIKPEHVLNSSLYNNWLFYFNRSQMFTDVLISDIGPESPAEEQGIISWKIKDNGVPKKYIQESTWVGGARTNPTLYDNAWHYLVVTFNGTACFIYLDGVLLTTSNSNNGTPATFADFTSAYISPGPLGGYGYNGGIAEAAVYKRALTLEEILAHYAERPISEPAVDVTINTDTATNTLFLSTPSIAIITPTPTPTPSVTTDARCPIVHMQILDRCVTWKMYNGAYIPAITVGNTCLPNKDVDPVVKLRPCE
jgi:hypothetical protein